MMPRLISGPEAFDRLSMDRADDVLAARMVNGAKRIFISELAISGPLIGAEQADFVRDGFANECLKRRGLNVFNDARDDIAFASDRADDNRFASTARSAASVAALVLVTVLGEAADESLINLDDAAELVNVLNEGNADTVTHIPSRFERTKARVPPELAKAHSLFADEDQVNDTIPVSQGLVRVLKDCAGQIRKAITRRTAGRALRALPMMAGRERIDLGIAATRANRTFRPAASNQVRDAMFFVWEQFFELANGQLVDLLWLLFAGHDGLPLSTRGTWHV